MTEEEEFEFRLRLEQEQEQERAATPPVQESGDTDPNAEGLQWEAVLRDKRDPQRAAERRQDPDFSDKMLGSMPGRIALGVATPVYGAGQFGANVGDWLSEKMGNEPVVGDWLNQNWDRVQDMKYRGMTTPEERAAGEEPWDVAGGLANVATAFASAPKVAGGALSKMGQMLGGTSKVGAKLIPRVAQGATTGAVYGGAQPGMDLEEQGTGAAWGAGLGGAAPPVMTGAGRGLGWAKDLFQGNSAKVRAGKIARDAAGEFLDPVRRALMTNLPGRSAGQLAHELAPNAATFQALQKMANDYNPEFASKLADAQQATRRTRIENVTPDLAAAEATRAANASKNYGAAEAADAARVGVLKSFGQSSVPMGLRQLRHEPILERSEGIVEKGKPLGDPFAALPGLHRIKMALDKMAKKEPDDVMKSDILDARQRYLAELENVSPLYKKAREGFAKDSEPVNQATALQEILRRLGGNKGREEAGSFLNVLGSGANAMIKKKTGQARFEGEDLSKVLTGKGQMDAVNRGKNELIRDAEMKGLASAGSQKLDRIISDNSRFFRAPWLSKESTAVNAALSVINNKIGESTARILADGMKSGKTMMEVIDTLPAVERGPILKVLNDPEFALKIARSSNAGVAAGAD